MGDLNQYGSRFFLPWKPFVESATESATSSDSDYLNVHIIPTGPINPALWVHHILPVPTPPLLARKWDYILQLFNVWYEDADGDHITIGNTTELVAAIRELSQESRYARFHFKLGTPVSPDRQLSYLMDELNRIKLRYWVHGPYSQGSVMRMDNVTKSVRFEGEREVALFTANLERESRLEEPEVHEALFDKTRTVVVDEADILEQSIVSIGDNFNIGRNVEIESFDGDYDFIPEHEDLVPTPEELSPAPSPHLRPVDHEDTPLMDLPVPPLTPSLVPTNAPPAASQNDPPERPLSEFDYGNPPFPGAFPDDPSETREAPFQDVHGRISSAVQSTIDYLARFGHETITTAQNTGFPVSHSSTFDEARRNLDMNAEAARTNLESGLESARVNLENGLESARTSLQAGFENARMNIQSGQETAREGIKNGLASTREGLTSGLASTRENMTNATRQVDNALRAATRQLSQSGAISPATADRVIQDLRSAGRRMERAVEDMALRLQRRIDRHAIPRETEEPVRSESQSSAAEAPADTVLEDLYGTRTPLPGSFPVEPSPVDECTDQLIEMGYFTEVQRDFARAVSAVVEGNLNGALEIMEGRAEQNW